MNINLNLNRIDISKSYFINKSTIKNNLKVKFEEIKNYQAFIDILESDPRYEDIIETMKKLISRCKDKINKETNIYFY